VRREQTGIDAGREASGAAVQKLGRAIQATLREKGRYVRRHGDSTCFSWDDRKKREGLGEEGENGEEKGREKHNHVVTAAQLQLKR